MASGLMTPIGMISFPRLFTPRAAAYGQEARYSCAILFDPNAQKSPEYVGLKKAVMEAGVNEWGRDKMSDGNFIRAIRLPFRSAEEKQFEGYEAGFTFINARSKDRPGVVDGRLQDVTAEADVWAGQLGRLLVAAFAYDVSGNKGISFALNHVQITKPNMPRIDGRIAASKAFPAVEGATAGGGDDDDEIPF
jgi:hypothetical protein